MRKSCYVYMMVSEINEWPGFERPNRSYSAFKVGISDCPNGRLSTFKTSIPFSLWIERTWKLPSREAAGAIERTFHREYAAQRLSGEWFYSSVDGCVEHLASLVLDYGARTLGISPSQLPSFMVECGCSQEYALDLVLSDIGVGALS